MNSKQSFFSMPHQQVNSTLCIIFLISWCIWSMVYYANRSVDTFEAYSVQAQSLVLEADGSYRQ
jgi:hypothetical protein